MERIEWCEELCVQLPEIDKQQEKLVEMFNRVLEAKHAGVDNKTLFDYVSELADFTRVNFAAEEKLLQRTRHPEYAQHRKDHRELLKKIIASRRMFGEEPEVVKAINFDYLAEWLITHNEFWDRRCAPFLRIHQYLDDCHAMKRGYSRS